jgi:hypothetical protein
MDFLSNLEKILVVLSLEMGESYFRKAEGVLPHPPPLARPLMAKLPFPLLNRITNPLVP